ncbi:hypothetical protein [Parasulfitobacter algicola]|uniref:Uncharacterized protein n=1 Tax=Parasulfitobacter algicola TaxID=2614809 RepID=A0ABX2ISZ3_9RHOB|nr:hypothetical protein [Sulfitobacter algicola]NSX53323.1 hypothetical protein [Sulfitobacter algicola]
MFSKIVISDAIKAVLHRSPGQFEIFEHASEDSSEQRWYVFRQKKIAGDSYAQFVVAACLAMAPANLVVELNELFGLNNARKRGRARLEKSYENFATSLTRFSPQTLTEETFAERLKRIAEGAPSPIARALIIPNGFVSSSVICDEWDELFLAAEFNDAYFAFHWSTTA